MIDPSGRSFQSKSSFRMVSLLKPDLLSEIKGKAEDGK